MQDIDAMPEAKRALLREGLKLFASRGVDCVSVRDIARATGFSNPALFRHFKSKDALAYHLFETAYGRLAGVLEEAGAAASLRDWLAAALHEIARSPEAVHFVIENVRRYWRDLPEPLRRQNLLALVRLRLEAEIRAGRLQPELDIPLARTLVVGALAQIARSTHFREAPIDPEGMADGLHDLLMRGFGNPKDERR